jgi:hypothetical protein
MFSFGFLLPTADIESPWFYIYTQYFELLYLVYVAFLFIKTRFHVPSWLVLTQGWNIQCTGRCATFGKFADMRIGWEIIGLIYLRFLIYIQMKNLSTFSTKRYTLAGTRALMTLETIFLASRLPSQYLFLWLFLHLMSNRSIIPWGHVVRLVFRSVQTSALISVISDPGSPNYQFSIKHLSCRPWCF